MSAIAIAVSLGCLAAAAGARAESLRPETVASGLEHPWGLAFLPDGRFLVTERPGRLRVVQADGRLSAPVAGLPAVAAGGQGGLLDVLLDSSFADNRSLYFCFSEPATDGLGNSTALARARLSADATRLTDLQVIFRQQPRTDSSSHFGCRIVERLVDGKPDGSLFLTLGERFSRRDDAQKLDKHHGKVVRVGKDGSVPNDNPFVGRAGALPEIWSYGHRNSQGAVLDADGRLWTHEHGPQGGDELNLDLAGRNYGWPLVSHGVHYGGQRVGDGAAEKPGLEPARKFWVPSIAPSGMAFLTSERYGRAWQGSLWIGSMKFSRLHRLTLAPDGSVRSEQLLLQDLDQRIRDVRQGPDGLLYLLTDASAGRLLRLQPTP